VTSEGKSRGSYRVVPVAPTVRADETQSSMTNTRIRFRLELEQQRDPIEGRLSDERGQTIHFIGWLELMSCLEKALADASDRLPNEHESAP
jgi:hypothetical protein